MFGSYAEIIIRCARNLISSALSASSLMRPARSLLARSWPDRLPGRLKRVRKTL